jgi:hypothetical protein
MQRKFGQTVDGGPTASYSSSVRRAFRSSWLLALIVGACASGDGGAVVVRWRLIDSSTGGAATTCDLEDPQAKVSVRVDTMRLAIFPASAPDGGVTEVPCPSCVFPCAPLEWTTNFEIPEGSYRFALEARACGVVVGNSPPAMLRSVQRGEITNLDAIGVAMPPCTVTPTTCPDGGVTITTTCDGGI